MIQLDGKIALVTGANGGLGTTTTETSGTRGCRRHSPVDSTGSVSQPAVYSDARGLIARRGCT
jgi:hypothetical protein